MGRRRVGRIGRLPDDRKTRTTLGGQCRCDTGHIGREADGVDHAATAKQLMTNFPFDGLA